MIDKTTIYLFFISNLKFGIYTMLMRETTFYITLIDCEGHVYHHFSFLANSISAMGLLQKMLSLWNSLMGFLTAGIS